MAITFDDSAFDEFLYEKTLRTPLRLTSLCADAIFKQLMKNLLHPGRIYHWLHKKEAQRKFYKKLPLPFEVIKELWKIFEKNYDDENPNDENEEYMQQVLGMDFDNLPNAESHPVCDFCGYYNKIINNDATCENCNFSLAQPVSTYLCDRCGEYYSGIDYCEEKCDTFDENCESLADSDQSWEWYGSYLDSY